MFIYMIKQRIHSIQIVLLNSIVNIACILLAFITMNMFLQFKEIVSTEWFKTTQNAISDINADIEAKNMMFITAVTGLLMAVTIVILIIFLIFFNSSLKREYKNICMLKVSGYKNRTIFANYVKYYIIEVGTSMAIGYGLSSLLWDVLAKSEIVSLIVEKVEMTAYMDIRCTYFLPIVSVVILISIYINVNKVKLDNINKYFKIKE